MSSLYCFYWLEIFSSGGCWTFPPPSSLTQEFYRDLHWLFLHFPLLTAFLRTLLVLLWCVSLHRKNSKDHCLQNYRVTSKPRSDWTLSILEDFKVTSAAFPRIPPIKVNDRSFACFQNRWIQIPTSSRLI